MQYVLAGILFVATFLGELFSRLLSSGLEYAGKKLLLIASMIAILAGFITAFYLAIKGAINGISYVLPPFFSEASSLVVPDNFVVIVTLQITARLLRFAYEWNVKILQWRL